MMDELDDKELDRRIAALTGGRSTRKRGRPPTGFSKALHYTDQVWALRRAKVPSWRARVEVAKLNRKTPEHISACVKMVSETPPDQYMEPDRTEEYMEPDRTAETE
jgi:hypothetical protein